MLPGWYVKRTNQGGIWVSNGKNIQSLLNHSDGNPATGAALKIKASKAPAFKAGATLKAVVNGAKK